MNATLQTLTLKTHQQLVNQLFKVKMMGIMIVERKTPSSNSRHMKNDKNLNNPLKTKSLNPNNPVHHE